MPFFNEKNAEFSKIWLKTLPKEFVQIIYQLRSIFELKANEITINIS